MAILEWLLTPRPLGGTIFILLLSFCLSFITSLANRLLTNPQQQKEWRKEIAEYNSQLWKARRENDKKLLAQLKKQEQRILQLQSKMFWQSMKVSLIFFIPFLIIWQILIGIFGNAPLIFVPGIGSLSFFFWYFLCSMMFSILFSRLMGVGMGGTE
jgi:uncharacterized membrane protein (DUF106 family)